MGNDDSRKLMTRRVDQIISLVMLAAAIFSISLWVRSYCSVDRVKWCSGASFRSVTSDRGRLSLSGGRDPYTYTDSEGLRVEHFRELQTAVLDRGERRNSHLFGFVWLVSDGGLSPASPGSFIVFPARWVVSIPIWVVATLFGLRPALLANRFFRRQRYLSRAEAGLCPGCGYDLRATPGRCPECGVETGAGRT